jgi:hypothetical protein
MRSNLDVIAGENQQRHATSDPSRIHVRIRITRSPTESSVDGISLSRFQVGLVYSLPVSLATLMIVEGWAEPLVDDRSADPTLPPIQFTRVRPPERRRRLYSDWRLRTELGLAADRRRKK